MIPVLGWRIQTFSTKRPSENQSEDNKRWLKERRHAAVGSAYCCVILLSVLSWSAPADSNPRTLHKTRAWPMWEHQMSCGLQIWFIKLDCAEATLKKKIQAKESSCCYISKKPTSMDLRLSSNKKNNEKMWYVYKNRNKIHPSWIIGLLKLANVEQGWGTPWMHSCVHLCAI